MPKKNMSSKKTENMTEIIRTDSDSLDFRNLIVLLDQNLSERNGDKHSFYAQFNKTDKINHVVVAYVDGKPVGCGALKAYSDQIAEIKRMFVQDEFRRQGIAKSILNELEKWATALIFSACILETGKMNPEAINLYQRAGYEVIPNYGQYFGVESSICMKKIIIF